MKATIPSACLIAGIVLGVISFVTLPGCCANRADGAFQETGGSTSYPEGRISVECNGNPLSVLGAALAAADEQGTEGIPRVTLLVRDDAVREVPRQSRWAGKELIAYYRGRRSDPKHQLWEYSAVERLPSVQLCVQRKSFDEILRLVCLGVGYSVLRTPDSDTVLVGPPELVLGSQGAFVRRVYQSPLWRQWANPEKIARRLSPCGVACAYDETSCLLVIIAERVQLNAFENVLEAFDAKPVGGEDGEEW